MKRIRPLFVVAAALLLCSCSSAAPTPAVTVTVTAEAAVTPTASPTPEQRLTASGLPYRADMDDTTRAVGEAGYIDSLREDILETAYYTDDALLSAGNAFCDSMDRGDSLQAGFIVVAGLLSDLPSTDSVAVVSSAAAGWLCPEHVPSP